MALDKTEIWINILENSKQENLVMALLGLFPGSEFLDF